MTTAALRRAPPPREITVIRASHGWRALDVGELWRYRELVYFLAWRDVKVRYRQTVLGILWALIQPVVAMVIFTIFLGRLAQVPSDGAPYALFAYTGLLPWTYFASAATGAAGSLVANSNLISKVYFPRLVIPVASVVAGLVDLAIGGALLIVLLFAFGVPPSLRLLLVPAFVALAFITALAIGTWLSALDVQYRDVRYAIPVVVQLWLFATPVVYPASLVPERYRALMGLNPLAGVVEGFRWSLLGTGETPTALVFVSVLVVALILGTGLLYFRRVERGFADVI